MNWTPKSEEQIKQEVLCPEGKFPFTILEAGNATSKKGKAMIAMKVNVHGPGKDYHVYDYISPHFMEHRFRHFFFCVGRGADYERGSLGDTKRLEGLEGYAYVGQQEAQNGYAPKNVIEDYAVEEGKTATTSAPAPTAPPEDDDIPF